MSPEQVNLVQQTFALATPQAAEIAAQFYQRLFALDPALRPFFSSDVAEQGDKLMTMLAFVVNNLHRPEQILEAIHRLGERHAYYGVEAHHYTTVGDALLWTLAQHFGSAFTSDVKAAWVAAYQLLAGTMQEATSPVPA